MELATGLPGPRFNLQCSPIITYEDLYDPEKGPRCMNTCLKLLTINYMLDPKKDIRTKQSN